MNKSPSFRIGGDEYNYLQVEVLWRSHPQQYDFWDGNWLNTKISLQAGGFTGSYGASLRCDEFLHFFNSLTTVYTSLGTPVPTRVAEFSAMEEQLQIVVRGDALGHFTAECVALDNLGVGNRLEFELAFDQTDIPAILSGLEAILREFPVRGSASD